MKVGRVVTSSGEAHGLTRKGACRALGVGQPLNFDFSSGYSVYLIIMHCNKPLGFMHFFICMLYCTIF